MLRAAERLPAAQRDAALSQLAPETRPLLDEGIGLGWISGHAYHLLANAMFQALSPERFRTFYTDVYLSLADLPVLGAITHTALRLGRSTPVGLARYAPPTWAHLAEGMGELELVAQPTAAYIRCQGYPTHLGPPELFVLAFAGTFDGFYQLCQCPGHTDVRDVDLAAGTASFWLSP